MIQINNELRDKAFKCACEHGFHDTVKSDEYWFMLIITEISESIDADRKDKHSNIEDFKGDIMGLEYEDNLTDENWRDTFEDYIKDTVEDELADIIIRCLDFFGLKNIDISTLEENINYNINNKEMVYFFNKRTFIENMYSLIIQFIRADNRPDVDLTTVIVFIFCIAKNLNIDILWHIEQKMKYNELRPMLNGKKY